MGIARRTLQNRADFSSDSRRNAATRGSQRGAQYFSVGSSHWLGGFIQIAQSNVTRGPDPRCSSQNQCGSDQNNSLYKHIVIRTVNLSRLQVFHCHPGVAGRLGVRRSQSSQLRPTGLDLFQCDCTINSYIYTLK